ncbi:hypothetical protein [Halorubrum sp. 2020YC2]|uniref:hypothetical protein n=1 Tax=Halorubrum sp. 2020YC2 TaxID=2836432 RepID=UPI001BE7F903|nr:hypothetical protein [Halorubrum sp. 2020YC2]QWC18216.1 hypothetical protein KI388_08525 [Halorubrum sp. 2020YC2]
MIQKSIFAYESSQIPEFLNKLSYFDTISVGQCIGYIGEDIGRGKPKTGYLAKRQRTSQNNHFSKEINGYPISEEVLEACKSHNATEIFIIEEKTGRVLEFTLNDYLHGTKLDGDSDNSHRCVPIETRRHSWNADEIFR